MKLGTWLEYHNINIFSPGAIGSCTPYGGYLGFQNGRPCGPVLLNISLSKTDIEMLEAPIPTFLGSKNPMVTENVHEYGSAILKSKMATTERLFF